MEQKLKIAQMAKIYNSQIQDEELLNFAVEHCVARVLLYLNRDELAPNLEIVVAQAVAQYFSKMETFSKEGEDSPAIASLSDNGQTITYRDGVKRAMLTAEDSEIFEGFEAILKNYRRVDVVA